MKRVLLAGILAGLTVFIWSFISHVLLPLGEMGISYLPNEEPVVSAMKSNIQQPGFYMIPGMTAADRTAEGQEAFAQKYKAGPNAVLIYHPQGTDVMSPVQLGRELGFGILCGIIAAWITSMMTASIGMRAVAVMLIGLFAWISISLPHWNWYRFPFDYTLAEGVDSVVGWLLGGLVIGWMQRKK